VGTECLNQLVGDSLDFLFSWTHQWPLSAQ